MALGSPPDTGQSSISIPFLDSSAAIALDSVGSMDDISMTTVLSPAPSSTPPSPRHTSLTCGEFGSIVMITSAFSATSRPFAAASAPRPTNSRTVAALCVFTTRSYPAFMIFFAMGLPIIPSPINPIFILHLLLSIKSSSCYITPMPC